MYRFASSRSGRYFCNASTPYRQGAQKRACCGFTLIELLIVIVIIAILATIVIPILMGATRRSKEANLKANLNLMRKAIELFHNDTGVYPLTLGNLISTTKPSWGVSDQGSTVAIPDGTYKGPYLTRSGGLRSRGIPLNPFISPTLTQRSQHWKYIANGGILTVPDTIADYVTTDGALFSSL